MGRSAATQQGISLINQKVDPNEQSFFIAGQKKSARPVTQYERPQSETEVDEEEFGVRGCVGAS